MSRFTDSLSDQTVYNDYKYVLQDSGSVGIGAKYSYAECMSLDNIPFKFKAITEHYILKDTLPETTIESHLYYMTEDMFSARTYKELRARVKIGILEDKKRLFGGKTKKVYRERIISIEELMDISVDDKKKKNIAIYELVLSKLALMGFTV